jgi:chorismate mutase/prephenate dehydratase
MTKRRANEPKREAVQKRRAAGASETRMPAVRRQIDELDARLVELLNQRAELAKEIGVLKAIVGAKAYAPAREMEVYRRVAAMNKGPLSDEALRAVYREVMSAAIALEQPIRVMYFGQPGSFTHAAAREKFGAMVEYEAAADPRDAALAVERGRADYAVLPVENSTEGGVSQTLDLLMETRLRIISEAYLPIHLHLLSQEPLSRIRTVYSHPQPFSQSRRWLSMHLGAAAQTVSLSTAAAAELAAKTPRSAAIGGLQAAELYGLPVRARNIEDRSDNITRFIVLGDAIVPPTGCDKTSIAVSAKNEAGALFKLLRPFEEKGVSMTRIESRPNRRKAWEYVFFVDFEGHVEDWSVKEALKEMRSLSRHMEVLGSYPRADHVRGFAKRQSAGIPKNR